jgi:hypothetical protein
MVRRWQADPFDRRRHRQAVAVLHHHMAGVAELGFFAPTEEDRLQEGAKPFVQGAPEIASQAGATRSAEVCHGLMTVPGVRVIVALPFLRHRRSA